MHAVGLDEPLHKWFDHKTPKPSVPADFIINALQEPELNSNKPNAKIVFIGNQPTIEIISRSKKGNTWEEASITFETKKETVNIKVDKAKGEWLYTLLPLISVNNSKNYTLQEVQANYEAEGLEDFELFWDNKPVSGLSKVGLLIL
jgi:hypothetical protein